MFIIRRLRRLRKPSPSPTMALDDDVRLIIDKVPPNLERQRQLNHERIEKEQEQLKRKQERLEQERIEKEQGRIEKEQEQLNQERIENERINREQERLRKLEEQLEEEEEQQLQRLEQQNRHLEEEEERQQHLEEIHPDNTQYTDATDALLEHWLGVSRKMAVAHNAKGKRFKFRHELIGIPATLLPIAYSPVPGLLSWMPWIEYVNVSVLITTGILSGIHSFYDFGRKSERHFQYEAYYSDLATTILVELSKRREMRICASRFVEMVQSKVDNYASNAPLL